jgi:Putative metal-binding motif
MIRSARHHARPRPASAAASSWPLLAVLGALAALAGCGPDGGIVLEIHRTPGVSTEVQRLELVVGVGHDLGSGRALDPAWWLRSDIVAGKGEVALPDGLGAATYRYKLDAAGGLDRDQPLVIAVIGYGADPSSGPLLFGHTTAAGLRFADGEVRVVDVPLETFSAARHGVGKAGCVWWNGDDLAPDMDARVAVIAPDADSDCDGFVEGHDEMGACQLDCDDLDPAISPDGQEVCSDGVDQNCCAFDQDGTADPDQDGVNGCDDVPDCVDLPRGTVVGLDVFGREVKSEDIHPGAAEKCDGIDNDCKRGCDDDPGLDPDQDGWLNCVIPGATKGVHRVSDDECVAAPRDCADDGDIAGIPASDIHPGADDDQCDRVDNDCSGRCDDTLVAQGDGDMDGFPACGTVGAPTMGVPACGKREASDCDDADRFGQPGLFEQCDGIDTACDGALFDHGVPCFTMDGARCLIGTRSCNDSPGTPNPFGACVPDNTVPGGGQVPGTACEAMCPGGDISSCLAGLGDRAQCKVRFRTPGGIPTATPCMPADLTLLADQLAPCSWYLVGGSDQGDWQVTLQRGGQFATSFSGCGMPVSLRVVSAAPDAAERSVLIVRRTALQVVQLRREDVQQCDGEGMVCD